MPCMMTTGVCPECSRVREKYRGGIFSWGLRMVTKQLTRKKLVHNLIYESILLGCFIMKILNFRVAFPLLLPLAQ